MDYGYVFKNTWKVLWDKKSLIVLGFLAMLGIYGLRGTFTFLTPVPEYDMDIIAFYESFDPELADMMEEEGMDQFMDVYTEQMNENTRQSMLIASIFWLFAGPVLWVLAQLATGSLFVAFQDGAREKEVLFFNSIERAWKKLLPLLGIGFLMALPGMLITILTLIVYRFTMPEVINPYDFADMMQTYQYVFFGMFISCGGLVITLPAYVWNQLAAQACLDEDLGLIASFKRGWEVFRANMSAVGLLLVLQVGVVVTVYLVLMVIMFVMALVTGIVFCLLPLWCILFPVFLVAYGMLVAYVHGLWAVGWVQLTRPAEGTPDSPAESDAPAPV